jgi:hypothetical protein
MVLAQQGTLFHEKAPGIRELGDSAQANDPLLYLIFRPSLPLPRVGTSISVSALRLFPGVDLFGAAHDPEINSASMAIEAHHPVSAPPA